MAYRMAPHLMLGISVSHTLGNTSCIIYNMFTHESKSAHGS